jgi:DNA (cytosine-5)-methyltransferase 1
VIENVAGARKSLRSPIMLCGMQFGLKVYRHRFFESNVLLLGMAHWPHRDNGINAGHSLSRRGFISIAGHYGGKYGRRAMGINRYVTNYELSQAYPPAYAEYLGRQLIRYVRNEQANECWNEEVLNA